MLWGFPGGSVVRNPPANAGDVASILGPGRSPGERNGNPLQYSCLGNPMDGGISWATVHGGHKRVRHDFLTKQQLVLEHRSWIITIESVWPAMPFSFYFYIYFVLYKNNFLMWSRFKEIKRQCKECRCAQSCLILCGPMGVALQVLVSMEFSRQEYWSG